MSRVWRGVLAGLLLASSLHLALAEVLQRDYDGFTVWLDCERRGAVRFRYNAQRDQGNVPRQPRFTLDSQVPKRRQQTSTAPYKHARAQYDRGHLVPANHLDASPIAITQSNAMTNIVPQAATMNRGAWRRTEEIVECYRDIDELLVLGGVIWGRNPEDDYFVLSHGIATPDALWKLILRGTDRVIAWIIPAWIIPNAPEATHKRLDQYLVSVEELERQDRGTLSRSANMAPGREARGLVDRADRL